MLLKPQIARNKEGSENNSFAATTKINGKQKRNGSLYSSRSSKSKIQYLIISSLSFSI